MKFGFRKTTGLALLIWAGIFLWGSCYLPNTLPRPNPAGFHRALSPFEHRFDEFGIEYPEERIAGMAWGNGALVAAGASGTIAYSSDYINWTVTAESPFDISFSSLSYGEGYFFAGGDGGKAAYSEDGVIWHTGVIGPMSPKDIHCVAVGRIKGRVVFTAAGADGRICYASGAPQGPWSAALLSPFGTIDNYGETIRALAFGTVNGKGIFVAAGDDGKIAFADDLSGRWYGGRTGSSRTLNSVSFGNDKFIAVGDTGMVKFSADPRSYSWTMGNGGLFGIRSLRGAAFDPLVKQFVAFGEQSAVGFSEFGSSWNAASFESLFPKGISALTCTGTRIILGGTDGVIAYSN
ncbi:MAG: hypothetical protein LBK02_08390 [Treponema sp.]|jgi:WD40 repeat protein|nr:hypothetical protein [Treponema sp.]